MCYDGNHSGSISLPRFAFYVTILQLKTNDKKKESQIYEHRAYNAPLKTFY